MPKPIDLFNAGQLAEAITASIEIVKGNAEDVIARLDLTTLLAFNGDLERADRHVLVAIRQADGLGDRNLLLQCRGLRNLLRGETARRQTFAEGAVPDVIGEFTEPMKAALRAIMATNEQNSGTAQEAREQIRATSKGFAGNAGETKFSSFGIKDDVTSSFFEVIAVDGSYNWISFEEVSHIEIDPLAKIQDLLWRHVHLFDSEGNPAWCFFPTLYYGTHLHEDPAIKCGRASEWHQVASLNRGYGVRFFELDETPVPILDIESLSFQGSK